MCHDYHGLPAFETVSKGCPYVAEGARIPDGVMAEYVTVIMKLPPYEAERLPEGNLGKFTFFLPVAEIGEPGAGGGVAIRHTCQRS